MRYANQTGRMVPASVCKVWPAWWPWRSSKGKLFHDERCRRGVRLLPLDGPAEDLRKEVAFYREGVPDVDNPNAAELGTTVVLGRTTRAFDNRQGIQDPRVSRRHALLTFLRHDPNHANGIVRMHALGHNPSTVKRANKTMPGELSSFKLRRGEATTLYPGDVVQFVCEDVSRAHGRSLPFEGNPCAYFVDYIPENLNLTPPRGPVVVYGQVRAASPTVQQETPPS